MSKYAKINPQITKIFFNNIFTYLFAAHGFWRVPGIDRQGSEKN
jgi:hypothetical protein|tara:strand:- start:179 stop:310 length:132 start_codon:yes stop_codon:yes gene_type:complete